MLRPFLLACAAAAAAIRLGSTQVANAEWETLPVQIGAFHEAFLIRFDPRHRSGTTCLLTLAP
jgi:hypothetical protein